MVDVADMIQGTLQGDHSAWRALVIRVAPAIEAMARTHRGLRSRGHMSEDDLAEVMTSTLERLKRDDFHNLKLFLEQSTRLGAGAAPSFDAWLYGALDYTVREHLRSRYGRAPKTESNGGLPRLSKRDVATNAARIPTGIDIAWAEPLPGVTTRLTFAQILRVVADEFAPHETRALQLYYSEEKSFAEIASELGLESPEAADKLVRRLNARLRYRFDRKE